MLNSQLVADSTPLPRQAATKHYVMQKVDKQQMISRSCLQ